MSTKRTEVVQNVGGRNSPGAGNARKRVMTYCFDIDGTLCTDTDGDYEKAQPFYEVIAQVNRIYEEGHRVLLYTARGSTTGIDWRPLTREQLKKWNVHYHELFMGKPTADIYIDDKALSTGEWQRRGFRVNLPATTNGRAKEKNG